ncbi:LysR family transcriptional regulator [Pusillimonas sp. T7-7]|nr:LysR family transcriptional regulator [Pusillimonas sp. T7-7]AEC18829.1 LysR family transcriptional regulator [Pusillimonas sp. T7-7]
MNAVCYCTVLAEEQHFHRPADRQPIEQSPLSRAIRMVEQEPGVTLFDRS